MATLAEKKLSVRWRRTIINVMGGNNRLSVIDGLSSNFINQELLYVHFSSCLLVFCFASLQSSFNKIAIRQIAQIVFDWQDKRQFNVAEILFGESLKIMWKQ